MNVEVLRGTFGTAPFSAREAAAALGVQDAGSLLYRLKTAGLIDRLGRGRYRFARRPRTEAIALRLSALEDAEQEAGLAELARRRWAAWLEGRVSRTAEGYRWN